jgi:eukaryotic-like serine/threonine-protein kinase
MSSDYTQHQSANEQQEAERLSRHATAPPANIPGFRIERFLGNGAFGQVWVGRDLNTGREVAIKFYLHRGGVNWSLLRREVRTLVALSADRHIVQVLDVGWEADPPYYVMEYLPNGSLEDLLRTRGTLDREAALSVFREICVGLNYAHGRGILHCDLKPANILLDAEFRPRIADFGQSRLSSEQTPALGTLFYMAPEQADLDAAPDARWDVYALGAIFYRLLVGQAPYRSEGLTRQIEAASGLVDRLGLYRRAIQVAPPPRDHVRLARVDRGLAGIIDRCLKPDPKRRFANVEQVLEAIDSREQARSRRPLMLLGLVGPLLLLLVICFFGFRNIQQARQRSSEFVERGTLKSNEFAAKFAASTMESELDACFRTVEEEAQSAELVQWIQSLLEPNAAGEELSRVADGKPLDRDAFRALAQRRQLERYLQSRLARFLEGQHRGVPELASYFVTDRHGTILASAFNKSTEASDSAGRNFAYRTYFNGQLEDLVESTPIRSIEPIRQVTLSSPFRSTATLRWKVAMSAPVYFSATADRSDPTNPSASNQSPDAVFVLTVNLGAFELPGSEDAEASQLAVLIDARPGINRGMILHHPLSEGVAAKELTRADKHYAESYKVPEPMLRELLGAGSLGYQDPLAASPLGDQVSGRWIAATEPVLIATKEQEQPLRNTGLAVLVQHRQSEVVAPVNAFVERLMVEGLVAIVLIVLVTGLLWLLVLRASGKSTGAILYGEPPSTSQSDAMTTDFQP